MDNVPNCLTDNPFPCEVFYVCPHAEECLTAQHCSPRDADYLVSQ
jgi:hypothetical protein